MREDLLRRLLLIPPVIVAGLQGGALIGAAIVLGTQPPRACRTLLEMVDAMPWTHN